MGIIKCGELKIRFKLQLFELLNYQKSTVALFSIMILGLESANNNIC